MLNEATKSGQGKGATEHYPEMEPEELKTFMYQSRRERENLRQMRRDTFVVGTDGTGNNISSSHQPPTTNHQPPAIE